MQITRESLSAYFTAVHDQDGKNSRTGLAPEEFAIYMNKLIEEAEVIFLET